MPLNSDGSLRQFTDAEIASWNLASRGIRDGSHPTEHYEIDSATIDGCRWFCDYESRYEVVEWLLGRSVAWDDSGTLKLSRLPPQTFPDKPKMGVTKVTRITGHKYLEEHSVPDPDHPGEFLDTDPPTPTYDRAEISALYEYITYELLADDEITTEEDRFVTYPDRIEPAGEFLQIPQSSGFTYHAIPGSPQAGSLVVGTAIRAAQYAIVIPTETFDVTFHQVPNDAFDVGSPLYARIYGTSEDDPSGIPFMGCINKYEIFGRPVGTVLFSRVRPQRRVSALADGVVWDLAYEFTYKPSGWNWLWEWAGDKSGWYWAGISGTGPGGIQYASALTDFNSLYNARDLSLLFRVS